MSGNSIPFAQLLFHGGEPAHVVPGHVGDLHENLAERRRLNPAERVDEVVVRDYEPLEHRTGSLLSIEINVRQVAAQGLDRGLTREGGDVRSYVAVAPAGYLVDVHALRNGHPASVGLEDLATSVVIGYAYDDLAVEPSRPPQRLIERVDPVGRADDHDVLARLEPVHERQQLRDDPPLDLAGDLFSLGRDGVYLVHEED